MSKAQITIDTETLGRGESAFFVQLAAVEFDLDGNILDTFERKIDFNEYNIYNFSVDIHTIVWWMQQSKEAQESVFGKEHEREYMSQVLLEFEDWIESKGNCNIWQHSSFDVPKVNYAIKEVCKRDQRIPYYYWKDIRTLTEVTGVGKTKVKGVAHDALDDCINQAKYITKCLNKIGNLCTC